jgi:hypothetical protein
MVSRGLKACALGAALGVASIAALAPSASAAGTITIEGFKAAAPKTGAPIPKAVVGPSRLAPGKTLNKCQNRKAIAVIFAYRGMSEAKDRIRVFWYRQGTAAAYFKGTAYAPDGTDGRAFRSLEPVPNGVYRADVIVNGKLAKRSFVKKACPA